MGSVPITRRCFGGALLLLLRVQAEAVDFSCPMHPEIRQKSAGKCPKCGMTLEARILEPVEYPMTWQFDPQQIPAGSPVHLLMGVHDPRTRARVRNFEVVHEKYFHLFVVGGDLEYFAHEHPMKGPDGLFRQTTTLPKPGVYVFGADFYPVGANPQLIQKVVSTAGDHAPLRIHFAKPAADLAPKSGTNLSVRIALDPPVPIPGQKTMVFMRLDPEDGIELYLGAWAHMLIVSNDLVDMMHVHTDRFAPHPPGGAPQAQFDIFFPRAATYRLWVQFQRLGAVNTVSFTIPVPPLG